MIDEQENSADCPNGKDNCPIYSDIQALHEKIETLSAQVRTDFLTGLFNKQHLLFSLEQEMERTQRNLQATTLILIDVDHFKSVNDTHGHITGDKVLTHLASIIRDTVRKIDIPCRYGGEEFAIILPSSPTIIGVQVAERLRKKVETSNIKISDSLTLNITISLGIDTYLHTSSTSPEQLIEGADVQLYQAKKSGRNRVSHTAYKHAEKAVVSAEEKDALFEALKPSED